MAGQGRLCYIDWIDPDIPVMACTIRFLAAWEIQMIQVAERVEQWGKQNHRWQNQTGQAEAELFCRAEGMTLTMGQGAPHGYWLEFAMGGEWGVVPQMMDFAKGEVMAGGRVAWAAGFG